MTSIVIFPCRYPKIFCHAYELSGLGSISPVPIKEAYTGLEDIVPALRCSLNKIIDVCPDEVHIITSGGTTKIGNIAILIGNLSEKFGLNVKYLWAARPETSKEYKITYLPPIKSEFSDELLIAMEGGTLTVQMKGAN